MGLYAGTTYLRCFGSTIGVRVLWRVQEYEQVWLVRQIKFRNTATNSVGMWGLISVAVADVLRRLSCVDWMRILCPLLVVELSCVRIGYILYAECAAAKYI